MKIKLVFHDWQRQGKSIYDTPECVELLSLGPFHSGTTFEGEIVLDDEDARDLRDSMKTGAEPVFVAILPDD